MQYTKDIFSNYKEVISNSIHGLRIKNKGSRNIEQQYFKVSIIISMAVLTMDFCIIKQFINILSKM